MLPPAALLRNLGGLLRKNLFWDERASCDRKLNVLDWLLVWHDLAAGEKRVGAGGGEEEEGHIKKKKKKRLRDSILTTNRNTFQRAEIERRLLAGVEVRAAR